MAIRPVVIIAAAFAVLSPVNARAEAFASYWSTLSEAERVFVDRVAASMYSEERGMRIESYSLLNSASKTRFRARAVEALGVENRPARVRKKAKEL
ncbi:MAG: hypothetical protein HXY21_00655 [Parvularculaceae bacterium]|nr:hypothetical protein [Parvularculaceae bacterium]